MKQNGIGQRKDELLKSARRQKPHRHYDGVAPWFFLAPSLIGVSIMILLPFADALRRSFFSALGGKFVGLDNYKAVLNNDAFKLAANNTVRFILTCLPMLVAISLLLAVIITSYKDKNGVFKTTFLLPMAIPVASIAFLWKVLFFDNGLINSVLSGLGMEPIQWLNSGTAFGVLVFTYLWKNTGYDVVLWLAGLSDISPGLYEAAEIDGAGALNKFFRITLPALRPTFFTVTVLSLQNSFKVFREAYLVAGSRPHESMYMLQHLFNNWFTNLDIDKLCAAATLLAVAMMVGVLVLQKLLVRKGDGMYM